MLSECVECVWDKMCVVWGSEGTEVGKGWWLCVYEGCIGSAVGWNCVYGNLFCLHRSVEQPRATGNY